MKIELTNTITSLLQVSKDNAEDLVSGLCDGRLIQYFEDPISGSVKIDYPMNNPDFLDIEEEETIGGLLWEIAKRYEQIYTGETKTMKRIEENKNKLLLNRGKSNGNYGIWGHGIGDLVFELIEIEEGKIKLFIGS